jgi:hypothetical protein
VIGGDGLPKPAGYRVAPQWLSPLTHPLIALLVLPLSIAWARVHRVTSRGGGEHVLALLALLLLLRCALDPWNVVYYALPFLLALLAWEALCRPQRPPLASLCATVLVWLTFEFAPGWLAPDMQSIFFCAWALPFTAWLARTAFATAAIAPERPGAPRPDAPRPMLRAIAQPAREPLRVPARAEALPHR